MTQHHAARSRRPAWSCAGLRAHGHHGVFDFERRDGQEFIVDVELGLDTRTAAAGDDLSATVALRRAGRAGCTKPSPLIQWT